MNEKVVEQSSATVKQEPPVEFLLILPTPTCNWTWSVIKEEDVKRKRMKPVKLTKFDAKWRGK